MIPALFEDIHPGENVVTPVVPAFRTQAQKTLPASAVPVLPEAPRADVPAASTPGLEPEGEEVFVFPATTAQRRFWLLDQLVPGGNPALNVPLAMRLRGRLDQAALERSLREIVNRHETLRTTFHFQTGRLCQMIAPELPVPLAFLDILDLPAETRADAPAHLLAEEAQQPFDLARGPAFRARLVRTGLDDHLLLFTVHYIVCDGWSVGVLQRELGALYTAFVQGRPSPLTELAIQYADYAQWQHDLSAGGHHAPLAYWRQALAAPLPVLDLPTDHPRQSFRGRAAAGAVRHRPLPEPLAVSLKALAAREGVSPFMLFLAGYTLLLGRYGGQEDVLVSTPSANRSRRELEELIGLFVNPLLLRADLSGNPTFRELLGRVRGVVLGAFEHAEVPFEKIIEQLPPRRLQANFLYQRPFVQVDHLPELDLIPLPQTASGSLFEWSAAAVEDGDTIHLSLEYNADLFEAETIDRVLASFETLLAAIAAPGGVETPIARLPLVPPPDGTSAPAAGSRQALLADRWRMPPETGRWVELCFEVPPATGAEPAAGVGQLLPGMSLCVLDAHGEPVPVGVPGEIGVDGLPGAGHAAAGHSFRTGDLGRLRPDGAVEWLGRMDRQGRIGGLRVDARGVEAALRAHPHIREVLVCGTGDGGRVVAYFEGDGAPTALVSAVQLRAFLKEQWPEESIPAAFVPVDGFPQTPDGWLDFARLPEPPAAAGRETEESYDAPYLTIHHQLIEIWQDLLDVRPIGIRDDFFDLGGNSLLAMRMLYRVEQIGGRALLPATLFQDATVEHLANEVLRRDDAGPAPAILPIQETGTQTPMFFLHGDLTGGGFYCLKLSRRLGPDQPFYALPPLDVSEYAALPEIEHIAAAQLATIRAVQPHGPYVLGGFCLGGLTAFEIARQLAAQGERVERLLIIDATVRNRRLKTLRRWVERLGRWRGLSQQRQFALFARWHFLVARLERWWRMHWREKLGVVRRRVHNRWQRLVWRFWPPVVAGNGSAAAGDWFDPRWDVPLVFLWATGGYAPEPYGGPATLLLSSDLTKGKGEEDAPREWQQLVSTLDTHELAGSHLACITEHVDGLAESVRDCLKVGSREVGSRKCGVIPIRRVASCQLPVARGHATKKRCHPERSATTPKDLARKGPAPIVPARGTCRQ